MNVIDTTWPALKAFVDGKGSSIQYLDDGSNYYLYAVDGAFAVSTIITKDSPPSSNQTDFETNYKTLSNQKIKVLSSATDSTGTASTPIQYDNFLPLNFGAAITSPSFPAIKPLLSYIVPTGKTLQIFGYNAKTAATSTYMFLGTRKVFWNYVAVALATPAAPTLTAKTITGSGLTVGIYRYKIVAVNSGGKTIGGTEASLTLSGAQNAIAISWTAVTGALYYEVYRTVVNGAINTEVFAFANESTSDTDVLPDSALGTGTPPVSNTTVVNAAVDSFTVNNGSNIVVVDTLGAVTTATPLDIIYINSLGQKNYTTVTPGITVGSQTQIPLAGLTNPVDDHRILRKTAGQEYLDAGMRSISSVGNSPVTGSYQIIGYNPISIYSPAAANTWDNIFFPSVVTLPAGTEIIIGTSASLAVTTASRADFNIIGRLI